MCAHFLDLVPHLTAEDMKKNTLARRRRAFFWCVLMSNVREASWMKSRCNFEGRQTPQVFIDFSLWIYKSALYSMTHAHPVDDMEERTQSSFSIETSPRSFSIDFPFYLADLNPFINIARTMHTAASRSQVHAPTSVCFSSNLRFSCLSCAHNDLFTNNEMFELIVDVNTREMN